MKTHELSEMLCIKKQTLQYYEKEGLISPDRDENGYRNYLTKEVETLKLILLLRSMEVSIEDIRDILNHKKSIRSVLEAKKDVIKKQKIVLEDIDKRIHDFIKRKSIKVCTHNENNNDRLCLENERIQYQGNIILLSDIKSIRVSICSHLDFMRGLSVFF